MQIYWYDNDGYYTGNSAWRDDEHVLENNEIDIEPPYSENMVPKWDGVAWNLVEKIIKPTEIHPKILTHLQFMNLLTDVELAEILTQAKTDVRVELWLRKFDASQEINLSDQRTVDGLHGLESLGILAVGRADEILNS